MKKMKLYKILALVLVVCMLTPCAAAVASTDEGSAQNIVNPENPENPEVNLLDCRTMYISGDNTGYSSKDATEFPFAPLTELSIKGNEGGTLNVYTDEKDVPVVAFRDMSELSLVLTTRNVGVGSDLGNAYILTSDSFGNSQKADNTPNITGTGNTKLFTGQIGSGALVIQTSKDGINYSQSTLNKFENGYYTTDYMKSFGGQSTEVYCPGGADLKAGIYIALHFYFETRRYEWVRTERYYEWWQYATLGLGCIGGPKGERDVYEDVYRNHRETYIFFIIEDSVDTVTFNNLTTADTSPSKIVEAEKPSSDNPEEYQAQSEQYTKYLQAVIDQITPTMINGSMTTTGFRINVTANPKLTVRVKRNGEEYPIEKRNEDSQIFYEVTESGKYEIEVSSYTRSKTVTLYVDNAALDEAYKRYFGAPAIFDEQVYGDTFLDYSPGSGNERLFNENSDVPVFKAPLALNLPELTDPNVPPLYGQIHNRTTGVFYPMESSQIKLTENGLYEIVFANHPQYFDAVVLGNTDVDMAGDIRVYKFNFKLVSKADEQTVNQQLLATSAFKDLSVAGPSDYVPRFYAVTRMSCGRGKVIVAFSTYANALQYAKEVVYGLMETHRDTSGRTYWLLPDPESPFSGPKIVSYSGWNNARILEEAAEKAVEERWLDLTMTSSYLTLEKSVENLNSEGQDAATIFTDLQLTSLGKSVIVWYNNAEREAAIARPTTVEETEITSFIGPKAYAILAANEAGEYAEIVTGNRDFVFVRDKLGLDSYSLRAEDSTGKAITLEYDKGLYAQLTAQECSPGIVQIFETNVYGHTDVYNVCYIKEGYQPGTLNFTVEDANILSQNGKYISFFSRVVLSGVSGCLDPLSFVRVTNTESRTSVRYYSLSEAVGLAWDDPGSFRVELIDRFGNSTGMEFVIK